GRVQLRLRLQEVLVRRVQLVVRDVDRPEDPVVEDHSAAVLLIETGNLRDVAEIELAVEPLRVFLLDEALKRGIVFDFGGVGQVFETAGANEGGFHGRQRLYLLRRTPPRSLGPSDCSLSTSSRRERKLETTSFS